MSGNLLGRSRVAGLGRTATAIAALTVCWGLVVSAGLIVLWNYEYRPGIAAAPPSHWPVSSTIARQRGLPTLIMLVHPHCPCSRASIEELDRLMAAAREAMSVHVLFLKPAEVSDGWDDTDLWRSAAAIPGVHVARDRDGVEAARFHAMTSGQVVLYDAAGHLLFSGGITPSRGHAGDNAGRSTVLSLLTGAPQSSASTPVFGCSLHEAGIPGSAS